MKIKLYSGDISNIKNPTGLLLPFSNVVPNSTTDSTRWDVYSKKASELFVFTDIENCDYALLPVEWESNNEFITNFIEFCKTNNKKVIIFFNSDSAEEIPVENSYIFRTSLYKSTNKKNIFSVPGWSDDFLETHFESTLLCKLKTDIPIVSFCGYPGNGVRQQAIDLLNATTGIQTNFIIRNSFWAGALGNADKIKTARTEYIENIYNSNYVVCSRGSGNFSYRLYETLSLGRIPLFINTDCVLPYDFSVDWKKYCVWVDEKDILNIGNIIKEYHNSMSIHDFYDMQYNCRIFWQDYISPVGFFENLALHFGDLNDRT
jgi:hypothetical protein